MILKTVGICSSSVHQAIDHVLENVKIKNVFEIEHYIKSYWRPADLVLCAKNPLAYDERLKPEGVEVQSQRLKLNSCRELRGVAELFLGQLERDRCWNWAWSVISGSHLNLLRESGSFPLITSSSPVLQSLLAVVVLVKECAAKEFVGRGNSLRTGKVLSYEKTYRLHARLTCTQEQRWGTGKFPPLPETQEWNYEKTFSFPP